MLSNLSNNNSGNKTKSVVEKKHYEEIENRLDEMQTDIDANTSAIAQNASDIETLDDRIDAVEDNSTFESISTDTIYPATGQTVTVDGDELVTGTLAAHDINTTELTVDGVAFTDVVDNSVQALTNSRAANYTANQARTKANEVDLKVDNLVSSLARELDTDLVKADSANIDALSADIATVDEITSHSITTDVLSTDLVKAVGSLVRPTIGQSYYTITFPENTIATLNGKYTIGGVDKKIFLSVNPANVYYFQESLEIIKSISFDRHSGAIRIVLKLDSDLNYISIDNGNDTVTILDGEHPFSNYEFIPEKLRGVITRGFWTNETETVVTGILKAYQLQAENEHFESTSVDDLFIEKSLNVPEEWTQSGIACFSSGLPDQYLSIDTMDGVQHPRWKDSANEATGTLNETNRLVTEETVAKWNGTSCDGNDEYYPITNIGDNAEVHGSATVDEDLTVTCDATVSGDLTVTGSAHLNADSADKLYTARCINGTAFDGTSDITTSKWGTERVVTVQDNDGSNNTTTCVDGSADFTLSLPATIKADVNGIACNAKCVEIKADSCNAEYNIPFETTSNATYQELGKDTCLKFNPSTNQLSTDRVCGTECIDTPLLKATQADITCNFTVGKNAVIAGDLTVAGTMHVNETENVSTGADIITMRTNNNSSLGTGCVSGLFINNYDGCNSMVLGTDKNGTFRVGDSAGTSTTYAEIYTDDEHWYNGTYPNGVQFTFSGSLTSYSSLRIETDTSVTPPKTYKIYDDAVITSVDISDMEPLATRAEASDMQDGYAAVWNCTGTDLVTNVNEAKVHGLVSDCKVCGVDFHGTNFCGTDLYGCLHGNAESATAVVCADCYCITGFSANADKRILLTDVASGGATGSVGISDGCTLKYNPSDGTLTTNNVKTGKACAGNGFTSDDTGTYIKSEERNELNIYTAVAGNTWINYRGGGSSVSIGDGSCTGCLGTVKAATLCGALSGLATGTSTYDNYCLDNCFTDSNDRPILLSDGSCTIGYSGSCALTFKPATGDLKNSGKVCATSGFTSDNTATVKVECYNELNIYPRVGDATWINYRGGANKVLIGDGDDTTRCLGIVCAATFCGTATQVNTVATSCNTNYYLTFVDSNNNSAASENVYTNGGLYYTANINRLWVVCPETCSFLEPGYLNLSGYTPLIDFRYVNYTGNYTTRLIAAARGEFDVIVNNGCCTTPYSQTSTFCFCSNGVFRAPGNIVTSSYVYANGMSVDVPSANTVCNLTFTARCCNGVGLSTYNMCLCGANGVLYLPQGANVPTAKATSYDDAMVYGNADENLASITALCDCRSMVNTVLVGNSEWRNLISIRHRNGADNGNNYGVALYQPMLNSNHWCYNQQITGTWLGEKQLIDSTGGQTIAGNLTVHNSSNNATLTADCFCGCINFNDVTDAPYRLVSCGDVVRKIYSRSLITGIGLIQSVAIGHCRHSDVYWGKAFISVGKSDNNTDWTDYDFDADGYITAPTGYKTSTGFTLTSNATCPISLTCGNYRIQLDCVSSVAIGNGAYTCTKTGAVSIGCGAGTYEAGGIAIGPDAQSECYEAIAIGEGAEAGDSYSVALGCGATANIECSIAIGTGACTHSGPYITEYIDCHVVYSTGASAHFRFGCGVPQCEIYCALACRGIEHSPMWPIGCGCTYCGRHMVPAKWIIRYMGCSEAGNWLSWDGDGNIDLTGTALGTDHAIYSTCRSKMPGRLEIWADWSFDYCKGF